MAKKKTKKTSRKSTKKDRMRVAAIAAVVMEMSKAGNVAASPDRGARKAPREAWKMAGRAERLGIA